MRRRWIAGNGAGSMRLRYPCCVCKRAVRKPDASPEKPRKLPEFSKLIVGAASLAYFVVLILGVYAVLRILESYPEYSIQALVSMFTYAAAPFASTLGFYLWKAKAENLHKHPQAVAAPMNEEEDCSG